MLDSVPSHLRYQTRHSHPVLKAIGIIFLIALMGAAAAVYLLPGQWFHHLISDKGSSAIGRNFSVDGNINIKWDWRTPTIELHQVRLANIDGAADPYMADIDQINVQIRIWKLLTGQLNMPEVNLVNPKIILEKFDPQTKNWDFPTFSKARAATHAVLPTNRSNFPIINKLVIQQGRLTYRDKTVDLDTTLAIDSMSGSNQDSMSLKGQGVLHGQPFDIDANGGSLSMLRESTQDYPLNVDIQMGKTAIKVHGVFHDPVEMEGIDTNVDIHGDNIADLFYITGIPLPPSPVYAFSGHLQETKDVWVFKNLKGRMGESDIAGEVSYDTSGERSYMKAAIVSKLLRMEDLGGFIGAKTSDKPSPPSDKLLPDMPLNLTRLRAADMDVDFKAIHINQPGWPIDDMDTHFNLKDGVLHIEPLSFGVANGTMSGMLTLDGREDVPVMQTDLVVEGLSLKPFFAGTSFESLSEGHFGGRFQIKGNGKSLARVLADSDGRIALMMSGGTISKLLADAAGLDIAKAAPELLDKDQKTGIRCAIADFAVNDGLLTSDTFVFDTTASNISGNAKINFKEETIDAKIEGNPKEVTVSGQIPITITGPLRHPNIGLGAKEVAARGGAAAVLAVLTPIAGVLPFIHIDLGKDSNCSALINSASDKSDVAPEEVIVPKMGTQ